MRGTQKEKRPPGLQGGRYKIIARRPPVAGICPVAASIFRRADLSCVSCVPMGCIGKAGLLPLAFVAAASIFRRAGFVARRLRPDGLYREGRQVFMPL